MEVRQEGDLKRGLKNRHIQLIALGGAIGTGLFLGIGQTIKTNSTNSPNSITTKQMVNRLAVLHETQSLKGLLKVLLKAPYPLNKILV